MEDYGLQILEAHQLQLMAYAGLMEQTSEFFLSSKPVDLPHAQIYDIEVKNIQNGYELWISCASRGVAVLKVETAVTNQEEIINTPTDFVLNQNYPNPFNPTTTISFSIPSSAFTSLKVYDILGNEVATLVNEEKPAGSYEVSFNASSLSSGTYFYKLQAGSFTRNKENDFIKIVPNAFSVTKFKNSWKSI
ncbi:MAG: T9SS type A sorting domain-containing protein [Ignavibacteriales bacterium]|nr:T9SS type A sorting domain-containing protein [Ignavibacteriales bacterium]